MIKKFPNAQLSGPIPGNESLRFLNFRGEATGYRNDVVIFTPPKMEVLDRVPLLVLLHGVYGCQWNWWLNGQIDVTANAMLASGRMAPMMIAMPSDGLWGDGSGYVPHAHANYERWVMDDLPRCLGEQFPNVRSDRFFLAGLSMGGYGAMRLGMKHAARVLGISAHSSITRVEQLSQFIPFSPESFQYAGAQELDLLHWAELNRKQLPPLRFDCGTEDSLIDANRELHENLVRMNVRHAYQEFSGGHDWLYWTKQVRETLTFTKAALQS